MTKGERSDLISRHDALNAMCDSCDTVQAVCPHYPCKRYKSIEQLPYTEIIHCRECKHVEHDKLFHDYWCRGREVEQDHYCGYAERKGVT